MVNAAEQHRASEIGGLGGFEPPNKEDISFSWIRLIIGIEESVGQLRLKYVPIFSKVISGKKTALFFQVDRRPTGLVDLQVASEVALVEP
jgi:hypothetical protein